MVGEVEVHAARCLRTGQDSLGFPVREIDDAGEIGGVDVRRLETDKDNFDCEGNITGPGKCHPRGGRA